VLLLLLGDGGVGYFQPGLAVASDAAAYVAAQSIDGRPTTARVNFYPILTAVELSIIFTDVSGDPVDPSSVVLSVTDPDQVVTTPPPVARVGTGAYSSSVVVSEVGVWQYSWQGTGAVIANSGTGLLCGT
jgi:hypothetical protein